MQQVDPKEIEEDKRMYTTNDPMKKYGEEFNEEVPENSKNRR